MPRRRTIGLQSRPSRTVMLCTSPVAYHLGPAVAQPERCSPPRSRSTGPLHLPSCGFFRSPTRERRDARAHGHLTNRSGIADPCLSLSSRLPTRCPPEPATPCRKDRLFDASPAIRRRAEGAYGVCTIVADATTHPDSGAGRLSRGDLVPSWSAAKRARCTSRRLRCASGTALRCFHSQVVRRRHARRHGHHRC